MPDDLVAVAFARDVTEAELIKGLLENDGIASMLRPAPPNLDGALLGVGALYRGFGGGPQQVLVHAARAEQARAVLAEALVENEEEEVDWSETANARHLEDAAGGRGPRSYGLLGAYARIYLWGFGAFAVVFGLFMLFRAV